jgi:hypothetical protein
MASLVDDDDSVTSTLDGDFDAGSRHDELMQLRLERERLKLMVEQFGVAHDEVYGEYEAAQQRNAELEVRASLLCTCT